HQGDRPYPPYREVPAQPHQQRPNDEQVADYAWSIYSIISFHPGNPLQNLATYTKSPPGSTFEFRPGYERIPLNQVAQRHLGRLRDPYPFCGHYPPWSPVTIS